MTEPLGLYGELFADAGMAAIFSDRAAVQAMLDFEAALARAEAAVGVIPKEAAEPIAAACKAELYDIAEIGRQTTLAGNPAIPLVKLLTAEVAKANPEAAKWVHWGATSQDVIDSGAAMQAGRACDLLTDRIAAICHRLAALADRHRRTVMAGRTLLQHAVPTTFGVKAAHWLDDMVQAHDDMQISGLPRLQFGGAAGTLASLGPRGAEVADKLMQTRGLGFMGIAEPWHTQRRLLLHTASKLGMLIAGLGKMARDVALMMQSEVAEAFEPAAGGRGGSSTMPHKRNPVLATAILAAAHRAPGLVATMLTAAVQEHERAVGGWHAEWETLPQLFKLAGAATKHAATLLDGIEIDAGRMRANLELTMGLVMSERIALALAEKVGRAEAKRIVEATSKRTILDKRHLRETLRTDPAVAAHLDEGAIATLFDPETYLGATDAIIDAILARYREEKEHMAPIPEQSAD
jgi:3-carboxy-cis,cis-muconate cycloisomerase